VKRYFVVHVLLLALSDVYLVIGMPQVRGAVLVLFLMTMIGRVVAVRFYGEPFASHDFIANTIAVGLIAVALVAWKLYRSASFWKRLIHCLRFTPQTTIIVDVEYCRDEDQAIASVIHAAFMKAGWKPRFCCPVRTHLRVSSGGIIPEGVHVRSHNREAAARIAEAFREARLISGFEVEEKAIEPEGLVSVCIYSRPGIRP
jgi:hypothetical protein